MIQVIIHDYVSTSFLESCERSGELSVYKMYTMAHRIYSQYTGLLRGRSKAILR